MIIIILDHCSFFPTDNSTFLSLSHISLYSFSLVIFNVVAVHGKQCVAVQTAQTAACNVHKLILREKARKRERERERNLYVCGVAMAIITTDYNKICLPEFK